MGLNLKAILSLCVAVALISAGFTLGWKWQAAKYAELETKMVEREKAIVEDHLKESQLASEHYAAVFRSIEQERDRYKTDLEQKLNENEAIAADYDNAVKQLRIVVLRQKPRQCGEATNTGGTETEAAELAPEVRRDIFNFRGKLIEQEALLEFCINHVKTLSADTGKVNL